MSTTLRTVIHGHGHYVPPRVVTNHDLAARMTTTDEWVVQRTGIRERRYVDDGVGSTGRGRDITVLFGGGAGAVVLGPGEGDGSSADRGVLYTRVLADGAGARELWTVAPTSLRNPRISQTMLDEGLHYAQMN